MEITEASAKQSKTILLRLSPTVYTQVVKLAQKAHKPPAVLVREMIMGALAEGVEIVPANGQPQANP